MCRIRKINKSDKVIIERLFESLFWKCTLWPHMPGNNIPKLILARRYYYCYYCNYINDGSIVNVSTIQSTRRLDKELWTKYILRLKQVTVDLRNNRRYTSSRH